MNKCRKTLKFRSVWEMLDSMNAPERAAGRKTLGVCSPSKLHFKGLCFFLKVPYFLKYISFALILSGSFDKEIKNVLYLSGSLKTLDSNQRTSPDG